MNENGGIISQSLAWLKQPFNTQGSALNWVLFFGLVVVALWFWSHVVLTLGDDL